MPRDWQVGSVVTEEVGANSDRGNSVSALGSADLGSLEITFLHC